MVCHVCEVKTDRQTGLDLHRKAMKIQFDKRHQGRLVRIALNDIVIARRLLPGSDARTLGSSKVIRVCLLRLSGPSITDNENSTQEAIFAAIYQGDVKKNQGKKKNNGGNVSGMRTMTTQGDRFENLWMKECE